ncbi:MAG: ArsR/SmtB family transcription factor [Burkholderiaceae bacterium]
MPAAHEPRLARVAAMIADPARSRMLAYLLDGSYASASELARAASVSASTASGHLAKLEENGFVLCEARGRHRYFRIADSDIAHALEALAMVAERNTHDQSWAAPERQRLRYARCCYGHMAGTLGVALFESLIAHERLSATTDGYELTAQGSAWLAQIGLTLPKSTNAGRNRFAYGCIDWSERRDHMAGSLARALLEHFLAQGWLRRASNKSAASNGGNRVLTLTETGRRALLPLLAR